MARIVGTNSNDFPLLGTEFEDRIFGLRGDDRVEGDIAEYVILDDMSFSWDVVTGRDDRIDGGRGHDGLYGEIHLNSGDEDDRGGSLEITGGNDRILGYHGDDHIVGDAQFTYGGHHDSYFWGGDDRLYGGRGNDYLIGDGDGEAIAVHFYGGDDRLEGGRGDDILWGDTQGFETSWEGALETGADTFVFNASPRASTGQDSIFDFEVGKDIIQIKGLEWSDLNTRGRNGLNSNDAHIERGDGTTYIDLGAAAGKEEGVDVLAVYTAGETLLRTDFDFA